MRKSKTLISQTKAGLCIIVLLCSAFLSATSVRAAVGDNQNRKGPILTVDGVNHKYIRNDSGEFWHRGVNTSTPEVDVNYTTNFQKAPENGSNDWEQMECRMALKYKDGSDAHVILYLLYCFRPGGLDFTNGRVIDWSKLIGCGEMLETGNWVNNISVASNCIFTGFSIINGSATGPLHNSTYTYLGHISYNSIDYSNGSQHNPSAKISDLDLSTQDYMLNGTALKESIATFNVSINATIGRIFNSTLDSVDLPVVLRFQVTHNITQTTYKYGLDANWDANMNFPTNYPMSTGGNYSLVSTDVVGLSYELGSHSGSYLSTFDTNLANDTATWSVNGTVLGKQYFTTQYNINGNSSQLSTKRYKEIITHNGTTVNLVNVWFTGFRYNISTGFSFDPKVVLYNSIHLTSHPTSPVVPTSPIIIVLIILGIIVVVIAVVATSVHFLRKRRKKRVLALEK